MSRKKEPARTAEEKRYLKQLGDNIRKIRQKRGYSQEEFAELAGFSRSYYTEVETGKRNISILNLIKILQVLKIDAGTLVNILE